MSIKTSVHNYNKSLSLFQRVRDLWDQLEGASDYQYMEALDKVDELQKHISKIDLSDIREYLEQRGMEDKFEEVKHNIKVFKEGAYRIGREILGWSYFNDLLDSIPRFITMLKEKYPLKYSEDKDVLSKRLAAELTHPDNVERYKSNIEAIIRGTMTLPYFKRIYDALMSDKKIPSLKKSISSQYPNPPEMYTGKNKEEWEENIRKGREKWEEEREEQEKDVDLSREKPEEFKKKGKNYIRTPEGEELQYDFETKTAGGVITYYLGNKEVYSYLGESFISLLQYKKLFRL
jgi:hypothetical protein